MTNNKIKKLMVCTALLATISITTLTTISTEANAESVGVKAEENWEQIKVQKGITLSYSTIGAGLGSNFGERFKDGQRYEVEFAGSGKLTIFKNGEPTSEPILTIENGQTGFRTYNAFTLEEGDYITIEATDEDLTLKFRETVDTDYTALKAKIKEVEALDKSKYTDDTVQALETIMLSADPIMENKYISQNYIEEYIAEIQKKIDALVEKTDTSTSSSTDDSSSSTESSTSSSTESSTSTTDSSTEPTTPSTDEPDPEKPKPEQPGEVDIKGKLVGYCWSKTQLSRTVAAYFDAKTDTLNFSAGGYYQNRKNELPKSIKLVKNQATVKIFDRIYKLVWENGEVVSIKSTDSTFSSQDDDINAKLKDYPVFSRENTLNFDAKSLEKYTYLNIDDKNIREVETDSFPKDFEFNYTDSSFSINIGKWAVVPNYLETAWRFRNIKLPSKFLETKIFSQEVGKTHYAYTFKESLMGGYSLIVMYFRLEKNGTMTVVRDYHESVTKGARYTHVTAKVELENVEKEKPVIREKIKANPPKNFKKVKVVKKKKEIVPETGSNLLAGFITITAGSALSALGYVIYQINKFKK